MNLQIDFQDFKEPIRHLVITGANGFVGLAFLDFIKKLPKNQQPQKITLISRAPEATFKYQELGDHVNYLSADLTEEWMFEFPSAHVLNLAADGSPNSYGLLAALNFESINLNLVNWAKKNSPHKVIHASSGACFGIKPLSNHSFVEQIQANLLDTKNRFIESRLFAEKILEQLQAEFGVPVTICRLFSFAGARLISKKQYAISSFVDSAISNKKIVIKGNPKTVRSYLDERDLSAWLWSALNSPAPDEILSIGSSRGVTIEELALFIADQTDSRIIFENPLAPGDTYIADNLSTLRFLNVSESKLWEESTYDCITYLRGINDRG